MESASTFRERAGVVVAIGIIAAYIAIGFVQYMGGLFLGAEAVFDPGWTGAMNGLAGGAVGFLIGKQTTNSPAPATVPPGTSVPATGDNTPAG